MSKIITYSEARDHLKTYLDYVVNNNDPVFITRKNGEEAVLISKKDYDSIEETEYLLTSHANKKYLLESINSVNNGDWREWKSFSIDDLKNDLK